MRLHRRTGIAALIAAPFWPTLAGAHEGHGLPGASHWHASDLALFIAAVVVVGLLVWGRRK